MSAHSNKYRAAIEVLLRSRDCLVENLADEIIDQQEFLLEGGYLFNEMLEGQGTRLHFLALLLAQLEQTADAYDEMIAEPPPPPPTRTRNKAKRSTSRSRSNGKKPHTEPSRPEGKKAERKRDES